MQAIELAAEIDKNQQIHLQLPKTIHAHKAKVIVVFDGIEQPLKPIALGLFKGKIQSGDEFNELLPDSFWLAGQ